MNMDLNFVESEFGPDIVLRKTKDLTVTICSTDIYQRYQRHLAVLDKHRDIKNRLNEFRRKSLELTSFSSDEDFKRAEENLRKEYEDILELPIVMDFLTSEALLNRMLRMVYDHIAEDVQIDLSYLGE